MPLYDRRLIRPALLVYEGFWIEPLPVSRFARDVGEQAIDDGLPSYAAFSASVEFGKSLRLSNLVRIGRPKRFPIVIGPAVVRAPRRALARFFRILSLPILSLPIRRDRSGNSLGIAINWWRTFAGLRLVNTLMLPPRYLQIVLFFNAIDDH